MGQAASTDTSKEISRTTTNSSTNQSQTNKNVIQPTKYEFVSSTHPSQQGSQVIPNIKDNFSNQNVPQPQKIKYKAVFNSNDLIDAFKTFAIDGKYLNQTRFNDAIEKLFSNIDIPAMHYTFLSEKIYFLLDESRDGKISEEEYMVGMKNVFVNKEFRLKLSMMAMMTRPEERNFIDFNEICEFFFKSWVYGYKHLGWLVKRDKSIDLYLILDEWLTKGLPAPTITQFELWASKFENHIRIYITNDFRECGLDPNRPIDYETFKKWIYRDHNLRLTYTIKNVVIATSLIGLDEIGFDETVNVSNTTSIVNSNTGTFSYPTFNR